jgi:hypothetical protein
MAINGLQLLFRSDDNYPSTLIRAEVPPGLRRLPIHSPRSPDYSPRIAGGVLKPSQLHQLVSLLSHLV